MHSSNIINISSKLQNKNNMLAEVNNSFDTFIGKGCIIRGKQEFTGDCCIDCEFDGEIIIRGDLLISENANVKANIAANSLEVVGKVIGDIRCFEKLVLRAGSHLVGNVLSPKIIIEEGAVFEGRSWMEEQKTSAVGG